MQGESTRMFGYDYGMNAINWWYIQYNSQSESLNGLQLSESDVYVHDTLEVILSYVNPDEILKLTRVCRAWKDLTMRRSFWKLVFNRNKLDWNSIPEHVKEKSNAWMVFYAVAKNHFLSKNLVWNHSGEDRMTHWGFKSPRNSPGFITESPPAGIEPLPHDPDFENGRDSAFVTSYYWATQQQKIDLWSMGLTPAVMRTLAPFEFVCSEMIGARFDCGAKYRFHVCLLDKWEQEIFSEDLKVGTVAAGMGWLSERITLRIAPTELAQEDLNNLRFIVLTNHGKDCRFWAGHYGSKFSRISIRVKCLDQSIRDVVANQEEEGATLQRSFIKKRVNQQNWGHEDGWFDDSMSYDEESINDQCFEAADDVSFYSQN